MRITDSRDHGGAGILPLQDHRNLKDREQAFQVVGARVVGRDDLGGQLGHLEHDPETEGDLLGGFFWPRFQREYGAWGFVRSCVTNAGGRTGSARPRGSVAGGRARRSTGSAVGSVRAFRSGNIIDRIATQGDAVGGGNGLSGFFDRGLAITQQGRDNEPNRNQNATGSRPARTVPGSIPDRINDNATPFPVVPAKGELYSPDDNFASQILPQPDLWPTLPEHWTTLAVADTDHTRQVVHLHPTDPRIPLPHHGESYSVGAVACDFLDKSRAPDPKRHARLHGMLRIVKSPPSSPGKRNVVAWNLADSGLGDALGGVVVDRAKASGPTTQSGESGNSPVSGSSVSNRTPEVRDALRRISKLEGRQVPGSVREGLRSPGDKVFNPLKANGANAAGSVVVAYASHNFEGPLHPGKPGGDNHEIGTDGDGNPVNPLHLNIGAYFIDPKQTQRDGPLHVTRFVRGDNHDFETRVFFGFDGARERWDWWTTTPEESYPPTDVPEPPDDDPPPPPGSPPGPPANPYPKDPPTDGPTTPPVDEAPPNVPTPPPLPESHYGLDSHQRGNSQDTTQPIQHTRRWLEMSTAAQSFRAQLWGDGEPNVVRTPSHPERPLLDASAPTVGRMEVFAAQSGRAFEYTNKPGASRYEGGTASGGLWYLPPEVTGEDYDDFTPGDRSISETVLGVGPGARLGIGLPDKGTGSVRSGHSLYAESGDLVADYHDASGTTVKNFRLTADGALQLRIIVTPTAPPSGYINLYAKSDGIYWQTSAGTETGPMSS